MMLKRLTPVLLACACVATLPATAAAQHTLNFSLGAFVPRGEDARLQGDVLNENLDFLAFEINDLAGASIGAEWLIPVAEYFEVGAGLGFYRRTTSSVYWDYTDNDGSEIDQDLRLRMIPLTATIKVLPMGQSSDIQPYFGGGVGLFNWRYSESGEFVDFRDNSIFREHYVADGNDPGAVAFGGIRFTNGEWVAGGEVRYTAAEGALDERFAGSKIDLGGWTYAFTLGVKF